MKKSPLVKAVIKRSLGDQKLREVYPAQQTNGFSPMEKTLKGQHLTKLLNALKTNVM